MIKVGITGGIGAGKSFVCKCFSAMGIPIYDADSRSKWLIQNEKSLIQSIKKQFGKDLYDENDILNKKALAEIVFSDENMLKKLNSIVHPAVHEDSEKWFASQKRIGVKYVLKEAALIYETQANKHLDKVIVVAAPLELRINRTMLRDRCVRQDVINRIDKQLPQEDKVNLADYVVYNGGTSPLLPQIWKIHEAICKL